MEKRPSKKIRLVKKKSVNMPKIPREFSENPMIREVLYSTVNEFHFDEQSIIYLYCFIGLSIGEIASLSDMEASYIHIVLSHFASKLDQKINIFKKASHHYDYDLSEEISTIPKMPLFKPQIKHFVRISSSVDVC